MSRLIVFLLLALLSGGCAGLREWLNDEPEFTRKNEAPEDERQGLGRELNDVEYAEYARIKSEREAQRRDADKQVFGGFGL